MRITMLREWWKPALVLAIDLLWGMILESIGRPLWLAMVPDRPEEVNLFLDQQLIPSLWISYGLGLTAQIGWLAWVGRQYRQWHQIVAIDRQRRRIRQIWWTCALLQVTFSISLQIGLSVKLEHRVNSVGGLFVLSLLFLDLLLIYWIPTTLLVQDELRSAIPPWDRIRAGKH